MIHIIKNIFGDEMHSGEAESLHQLVQEKKAHLSGAHLSGADLSGAYLSGADLSEAHLSGAHLRGAHLSGADLRGADLSGAHLSGAHLRGADLSGAYLSGAHLSGAYLSGAHLRGAIYSGITVKHMGVFTGLYKYHVIAVIAEDRTNHIRMGCYLRTVQEWEADFWNNQNEFPNNGDTPSKLRRAAYEYAVKWLELMSTQD